MAKQARRLGRGLDSLVSDLRVAIPTAKASDIPGIGQEAESTPGGELRQAATGTLPTDALNPNPMQPRHNISDDNVASLASSIQANGILQPIVIRRHAGQFQIIAGERRWRAAKAIGLREVPVVVREASDQQMLELALIENIQREDLNAIDRAKAYRTYSSEFGLTPEQVAGRLGEDRTTVLNYLRLLDLAAEIQAMVADGRISMGHARCLLGLTNPGRRLRLAESVVANALSVRALEGIVRREKERKDTEAEATPPVRQLAAPHVRDLEKRLEEAVKTKVTIREGKRKGSGRIIIEYYSLDDFDRITAMLGLAPE